MSEQPVIEPGKVYSCMPDDAHSFASLSLSFLCVEFDNDGCIGMDVDGNYVKLQPLILWHDPVEQRVWHLNRRRHLSNQALSMLRARVHEPDWADEEVDDAHSAVMVALMHKIGDPHDKEEFKP